MIFAGYKVPHPLQHEFIVRIQTTSDYTPQEALMNAVKDLISEIALLEERFRVCLAVNRRHFLITNFFCLCLHFFLTSRRLSGNAVKVMIEITISSLHDYFFASHTTLSVFNQTANISLILRKDMWI